MKNTVYDRLLRREIGDRKRYASVRGIYGDRHWVDELDIVNELGGHHGCVNALSWSTSGRLLASGSDDHRINIHSYHPESSTSQFNLTTSILTGHRSNIFSVKFMPYSSDRTIVSATDDVRIFDIEHSGHSLYGSSSSSPRNSATPRRRAGLHSVDGVTLTEGDTNAKAFRCHTDTVKRIVTEDNPFYFLTCSEDGDVRQWDIRQPARTYPPAKSRPRWTSDRNASDDVPPPLISYSRYNLDLNTVSCSPSQPHYIALGGAHLHCFLHDRRMLGRDRLKERGASLPSPSNWNDTDDMLLGQATQCVKKFAPNGQQRMGTNDSGHITACKISDANPNELVVSWSGDWIYSFDIQRSPDATEATSPTSISASSAGTRVKDKGRKRKGARSGIVSQEAATRAESRQRTESSQASGSGVPDRLALRVNYGNGQSEEIRIEQPQSPLPENAEAALSDTEHFRIAQTTARIQKLMLSLNPAQPSTVTDGPKGHSRQFTSVLGFAASALPDMDDLSRSWRYPLNPSDFDVAVQNQLRSGRDSARRFVQAAGTLARVLGGRLRTGGNADALISRYFTTVGQSVMPSRPIPRHEHFGYDFLKAILLWLDSGLGALVDGFSSSGSDPRRPIPLEADVDAIDEILIPYLLHLAGDGPIVDVDVSRFELDETRILYSSQKTAVIAFAQALKIPFADLTGAVVPTSGSSSEQFAVQDRQTALSSWAFKVGRGILLHATKKLSFRSVDKSFGGTGIATPAINAEQRALREQQEDVDPLSEDDDIEGADIISDSWASLSMEASDHPASSPEVGETSPLLVDQPASESTEPTQEDTVEESDDDSDGDIDPMNEEDDEDEDEDEDAEDEVDEDGLSRTRSGRVLWRSDFDRSRRREKVESHITCTPHTRAFSGHCNVRTVKDVNFFGLQDEFVVSGSDSGHVFIWDRKTSQLLNILEGDGEVVNVVQGHPYEPTMAVSGIDHTIKIFSPDAQDQRNARKGIGIQPTTPGLSSLGFGRRRRPRQPSAEQPSSQEPQDDSEEEDMRVSMHGLSSRKRMREEYEITSQNDMERRGGREDAFITRALLTQLAQRLHAHHGTGGTGEDDGDGEGRPTIVLNDEDGCNVM